jgi:hypothetical protein
VPPAETPKPDDLQSRYFPEAAALALQLKCRGLLLVVIDGPHGNGAAVMLSQQAAATELAAVAASVAGQLEQHAANAFDHLRGLASRN